NFATSDGTALVADGDYVATSGTLQFAANENTKTISVTINGDTNVEANESFSVFLSDGTYGATISRSQVVATITTDDDARFLVFDEATSQTLAVTGDTYPGPVVGLDFQYINTSSHNLNVVALVPNTFIHTGDGFDAIDVRDVGGVNVLDGETNSN